MGPTGGLLTGGAIAPLSPTLATALLLDINSLYKFGVDICTILYTFLSRTYYR